MLSLILANILELRTHMRKVLEEFCRGHGGLGVGHRVREHGGEERHGEQEHHDEGQHGVLVQIQVLGVQIERHQRWRRQILT